MELFKRPSNDEEYLKYKESIVNIINRNNFLSFSKSKIKKFLSVENEQHFLRYRFELLNSWSKQNLVYTKESINKFDVILKKLMLVDFLYPDEEFFLYSIRNIAFAKKRNLKSVLTDLELPKREFVYYFYAMNKYKKDEKDFSAYQVCLSNFNLFLRHDNQSFEKINYEEMVRLHLCDDSLIVQTNNNKYTIHVSDPKLLYVSLERMLKIRKIL